MGLSFLEHAWLYALPGLLAGLTILYFLKLKRREVVVSSTWLWKKALEDLRVNSPFQRLRMNLLLLLQLLALSAVTLSLARPVSTFGDLTGRTRIIIVDRSASMQATDGGGGKTRLERALDEARAIVGGMGYGDQAVLVALDDRAELLTPLTDRRDVLRAAIDKIAPTDKPTRMRAAMDVALSIAGQADARRPEVTVLSDGRGGPLGDAKLPSNAELRYVRIGEAKENVGIVGIDIRRAFQGEEASRVFVTIGNSGAAPLPKVGVDCFLTPDREGATEELVTSREIDVPGRPPGENGARGEELGKASLVLESPKLRAGKLRIALDVQDALPADNQAYCVLREKRDVKTLLVTDGNVFLKSALSEDPLIAKRGGTVPTVSPSQFAPDDPSLKQWDLIVLDRVEPRTLPPGNYLMFEAVPPFEGFGAKGVMIAPQVLDWNDSHPVARFVSFSSLDCARCLRLVPRKGDRVVIESNQGPLVVEARDGERRCLVCAFDLLKTQSWPLRAAFPLFLANAVRWLGGAGHDEKSLAVATGDVAEIPLERNVVRATVTDPAGKTHAIDVKPGEDALRFGDTTRAGFYTVELESQDAKKQRLVFAANIANEDESDIEPVESMQVEGKAVRGEGRAHAAQREVWKIVVLIGFFVLLLEWWVYNRRVFV